MSVDPQLYEVPAEFLSQPTILPAWQVALLLQPLLLLLLLEQAPQLEQPEALHELPPQQQLTESSQVPQPPQTAVAKVVGVSLKTTMEKTTPIARKAINNFLYMLLNKQV